MRRYGRDIRAEFSRLGENQPFRYFTDITECSFRLYQRVCDKVYLAYAQFINTMHQTPVIQQLLPVEPLESNQTQNQDFIFEPSAQAVLGRLLPRFIESEVYHAILESIASEQSARMVAMRNAQRVLTIF